uniref:Uncharacterized protein n=1 Tax=Rhizophora mucronata TaxID=61149 RepID=A0A2P2PCP2_RHIMU
MLLRVVVFLGFDFLLHLDEPNSYHHKKFLFFLFHWDLHVKGFLSQSMVLACSLFQHSHFNT